MEDDRSVTSTTDGPRRADDADVDDVVALLGQAVVADSIEAVTGAGAERVLLTLEAFEQAAAVARRAASCGS